MISSKPVCLILIIFSFIFTSSIFPDEVFGHGLTSEVLQGKTLDEQGILLNLYSTTSPTEENHREIFLN